jgi:hypothetical protein
MITAHAARELWKNPKFYPDTERGQVAIVIMGAIQEGDTRVKLPYEVSRDTAKWLKRWGYWVTVTLAGGGGKPSEYTTHIHWDIKPKRHARKTLAMPAR